jgi:predicted PurR-regulated permease PerM
MSDAPAPASPPPPPSPQFLSDGQRRIAGFAIGLFALLGSIALLTVAFLILGRMVGHFSGVLWPLAVAGIAALILRPVVDFFQFRLKLRRPAAVTTLYGLVVLACAGLLFLITPAIIEQIFDFIAFIPEFWKRAVAYVLAHYPEWMAIIERRFGGEWMTEFAAVLQAKSEELMTFDQVQGVLNQILPSLNVAVGVAIGLGAFFTQLAIIPIYLFFFLLSRAEPTNKLGDQLTFLPNRYREDIVFLVREFIGIVVSFFRGQMLIGLIMGAMLALGFSLVGLKFGLVIGLALGVLNIIPYLGTIVGLSIALPLAFLQPEGGWQLVAWVLAVFIVVQNIEGWFLTPKIMGDRTGLHPVVVIIAIFFWGTALNGILGMILAIPLTAFFVTAWRLAKHKYFHDK